MRSCPNCGSDSIPVLAVALGARPRCRTCHKRIGPHWLVSGIFACASVLAMIFVGLFLLGQFGLLAGGFGLLVALFGLGLVTARFAPLEVKQTWWAS